MTRKTITTSILVLALLAVVLGVVFGWQFWRKSSAAEFALANNHNVIDVEVGMTKAAVWYPQVQAIGSVVAVQGVEVSPQIDGPVSKLFFTSGELVQKGHPLAQLDDETYQADVANALASYNLAKLKYHRNQQLLEVKAISQSVVDQAKAEMDEAFSELKKTQAQLNQTLVKAPFAGRLGLRQVSLGQYVNAGSPIVSLQQITPVYVDFQLPESYIGEVKKGYEVKLKNSAYPKKTFEGKVVALNAVLNQATRTLNARAEIQNPKGLLVPNMFTEVTVVIPTKQNVIIVPQMAINYSPFGDSVFKVVNGHAKAVYVHVGESRGAVVAVDGDLKANEPIVTVGIFKIQDGGAIRAVNHVESMQHTVAVKPKPKAKATNKLQQANDKSQAFSETAKQTDQDNQKPTVKITLAAGKS
tara:strand:+ start:112080 stop:113321 length:1242 start_codon:yes stop_codon:yes gene_type:complete